MSRHIARETALQMLFQIDVGQNSWETAQNTLQNVKISSLNKEFVMAIVRGTLQHQEELDGYIKKYAAAWDLERMANVDRNILRLALYEMKYREDIPASVSINEAIELAKSFGNADSGKFVNGILDSIRKEDGFLSGEER